MKAEVIVTIIVAVFASTGFWQFLTAQFSRRNEEKTAEAKLLLGIAYKEIVETCRHYISAGEISADEYKELNHYLFKPYKELGGNGTAERLMKEVEKLPLKGE